MISELVERFKVYAEMEEKHAKALRSLAAELKHPVLATIFMSIARDSEKHADVYRSLAKLLSEVQPFISEDDLKKIAQVIDTHINTEAEMLRTASELMKSISDPRAKLLLAAIADDEHTHHKLLLNIKEKIAKAETITEELVWDMIWKDSPWHGTPGG